MKTFVLPSAVVALAWLAAAPEASARPHRDHCESSTQVCRYTRCGCPVYVERYVAFFDEYGEPVWRRREVPVVHRCDWERPRHCDTEYREVHRVERRSPPPVISGGITIQASW